MTRLELITRVSCQVEIQWECEFDAILASHPELQTHPMTEHSPLVTHNALYGGRTEAVRLHYKIQEDTIQYVGVMSLPLYMQVLQVPHMSSCYSCRGCVPRQSQC
jgi:hypothetical protein